MFTGGYRNNSSHSYDRVPTDEDAEGDHTPEGRVLRSKVLYKVLPTATVNLFPA